MKENLYTYKATVIRVIDGDTVLVNLDRGFKDFSEKRLRLAGIDAPQLDSEDPEIKKKASESKEALEKILPVGKEIIVKSIKLDMYGRPLSYIFVESNKRFSSVNDEMVALGFAILYK